MFVHNSTSLTVISKEKESIKAKYKKEQKERKRLYNELADYKGNIRVYARVRPQNAREKKLNSPTCTSFPEEDTLLLRYPDRAGTSHREKTFEFDKVYRPESTQANVFADTSPVIETVLDGYNVWPAVAGFEGTIRAYFAQMEELAARLAALPYVCTVFPSDANFLLVRLTQHDKAKPLYTKLAESGVVVRYRGDQANLSGCIRVTVGTPSDSDALLKLLGEVAPGFGLV